MAGRQVLAFDWGTTIIGILNVNTGRYVDHRYGAPMVAAAKKLFSTPGTIVSFNGNNCDLLELSKILGRSAEDFRIRGKHDDMREIISNIRWPPDPGTAPITGTNLSNTFAYYFQGRSAPTPPAHLAKKYGGEDLGYVVKNWLDCYMAAELWKKWKRGELTR